LNFLSHHLLCHKRRVISGDRIVLLSHSKIQQKNFINAIHIFLDNGCPLNFIFSTIQKRINYHIHNKKKADNNLHSNKKDRFKDKYFTVPYVKFVSKKFVFIPIALKLGCKLLYFILFLIS